MSVVRIEKPCFHFDIKCDSKCKWFCCFGSTKDVIDITAESPKPIVQKVFKETVENTVPIDCIMK